MHLNKNADDIVIIGKASNDDSRSYLAHVDDFMKWGKINCLELNDKKTKELIIDSRTRNQNIPDPIIIEDENIERVSWYKYLGYMIDNQLKNSCNTDMVTEKCNQRLYFLRILSNVHVDKGIISLSYKSTVESIIIFSIAAKYGMLICKGKNKLGRIVKKAKKLDAESKAIDRLYQESVMKQIEKIMKDANHPLHSQYVFLRSGRWPALLTQHTDRYKK